MSFDPVPHLAALINGVQDVLNGGTEQEILTRLAKLATGPYAALRGGLLLDEPGTVPRNTTGEIRKALRDAGYYTRSEIEQAVNAGANLVTMDPDITLPEGMYDIVNAIVNAQLSLLDNPQMTLDQVIAANWDPDPDDDPDYEGGPGSQPQETQAEHDARVIRTVRSWWS